MSVDPSLAPDPTDSMPKSRHKMNQLFTVLAVNPDPSLASQPTDNEFVSGQKLNQLLYNQAAAISNWNTPTVTNGTSDSANPVQWRYEPYGVVRLRGNLSACNTGTPGTKVSGLPPPNFPRVGFTNSGATLDSTKAPCSWQIMLDPSGALNFAMIFPQNIAAGGSCGLSGITYTYQ